MIFSWHAWDLNIITLYIAHQISISPAAIKKHNLCSIDHKIMRRLYSKRVDEVMCHCWSLPLDETNESL